MKLLFLCFLSVTLFAGADKAKQATKQRQASTARTDSTAASPNIAYPLSDNVFHSLYAKEKLEYAIFHPEAMGQGCYVPPPTTYNEKPKNRAIILWAQLSPTQEGKKMSLRQKQSLKENRDSVVHYLDSAIRTGQGIPNEAYQTIVDLAGYECIPAIIADTNARVFEIVYSDITCLMLLMKKAEYTPFTSTRLYKELYGDDKNYFTKVKVTNTALQHILKLAHDFYTSKAWKK